MAENFSSCASKENKISKTDEQHEKNFSLEDLCEAANSDLIASITQFTKSRPCVALDLSFNNIHPQGQNISSFVSNVEPCTSTISSTHTKHGQNNIKEKFQDKNKCEYCGKICAKPSILQKHIRAHTNERPYPCEECGVHFKTKSNLYKHCKSRTHLIQTGHTSRDANETNVEKSLFSLLSPSNHGSDTGENISNSCDGQEDVSIKFQISSDVSIPLLKDHFFVFDQLESGQIVLKPLNNLKANVLNPTTNETLTESTHTKDIVSKSQTSVTCHKPLLKSLSEKSSSRNVQPLKPHSHSFSSEVDMKHIPKLDRMMTNDDIQKRISMLISLNDYIIDTPKEIKNHRFRKVVRNYSESNNSVNTNLDVLFTKSITRANSLTPTSDYDNPVCSGPATLVVSSKPNTQSSHFLTVPSNDQLKCLTQDKSMSDNKSNFLKFQQLSLPTCLNQNLELLKGFNKAYSFGDSHHVLSTNLDQTLAPSILSSKFTQDNFKIDVGMSNERTSSKFLLSLSKGSDVNLSSPTVSPRSSPSIPLGSSTDQQLKQRRGRPKGSKNRIKLSPTSSSNVVQPIIPSIQITSVEETPKESHWRKELKKHLLMKRSLSNENSAERELLSTAVSSGVSRSSCAISSPSIQHLSFSSVPIKKRRKTLTELGRGTVFGTTVDDNLDACVSARKSIVKPLWSSDGSFNSTIVCDENDNLKGGLNSSENSFENYIIMENNADNLNKTTSETCSLSCIGDNKCSNIKYDSHFLVTDVKNSVPQSTSFPNFSRSSFIAVPDPQYCKALNVFKDRCVLIPTHYLNQTSCNDTSGYSKSISSKFMTPYPLSQPPGFDEIAKSNFGGEVANEKSTTQIKNLEISESRNSQISISDPTKLSNVNEVNKHSATMQSKFKEIYACEKSGTRCMESSQLCVHSKSCQNCRSQLHTQNKYSLSDSGKIEKNVLEVYNSRSFEIGGASMKSSDVIRQQIRKPISPEVFLLNEESSLRADSEAAASLLDLSKSSEVPPSNVSNTVQENSDECNLFCAISLSKEDITAFGIPVSSGSCELPVSCHKLQNSNCLHTSPSQSFYINDSCSAGSIQLDPPIGQTLCKASKSFGFVEGKYICPLCQKVFSKEHCLLLHKNLHYMEKPHRCSKCQATFQTNWLLKRHQNMVHHLTKSLCDPRPFKCTECKIAFRTRGHLAKHARSKLHSQKSTLLRNKNKYDFNTDKNNGDREISKPRKTSALPCSATNVVQNPTYLDIRSSPHINTEKVNRQEIGFPYDRGHSMVITEFKHGTLANVSQVDGCFLNVKPIHKNLRDPSQQFGDLLVGGNCLEPSASKNDGSNVFKGTLKPKKLSLIGKLSKYNTACEEPVDKSDGHDAYNINCKDNPHKSDANTTSTLNSLHENVSLCQNSSSLHFRVIEMDGIRSCDKNELMKNMCRVCQAEFFDIKSLLDHYECHLEKRPYICSMCDAGFKTHEGLKSHVTIHSEKHLVLQSTQTSELEMHTTFSPIFESRNLQHEYNTLIKTSTSPSLSNFSKVTTTTISNHSYPPVEIIFASQHIQMPPSTYIQSNDSIVSLLSQKCCTSSYQQISQNVGCQQLLSPSQSTIFAHHVEPDIFQMASKTLISSETESKLSMGSGKNLSDHLFLQHVSDNNISLFPNNTCFLTDSQICKDDNAGNSNGKIYFYNPVEGYFFVTSAKSLAESPVPMKRSSFPVLPLSIVGSKSS